MSLSSAPLSSAKCRMSGQTTYCFCGFFLDHNFQVRGDILVQLDRYREFAQGLQRLVDLNLAAVNVKALLGQRIGDVA